MKATVILLFTAEFSFALVCFHCPSNKNIILDINMKLFPNCFTNFLGGHKDLGKLETCKNSYLKKCATEFICKGFNF